jgi:hypothetical protein
MERVYHYTDTARLPWILRSGELRPRGNQIGDFPPPDFVWATTSGVGDRSATASMQTLRAGLTRLVRFVLRASDFEKWPDAVARFPAWTADEISRLERAAQGMSSPALWRCRTAPLPREAWVAIETRSWTNKQWKALPLDDLQPIEQPDGKTLGIVIDGTAYLSTQVELPDGARGYEVHEPERV